MPGRLAGTPGLPAESELRGSRPIPFSAAQGRRTLWSIYIDDFFNLSIGEALEMKAPTGQPSETQAGVRARYGEDGVPRNMQKTTEQEALVQYLGYSFEGDGH